MLLTCCFRESKSDRRAREGSGGSNGGEDAIGTVVDGVVVRQLQPQVDSERPDSHGSELIRGGGGSGGQPPPDRAPPDRRLTNASPKERAPLRKDEKRLYKQKSQESLGKASGQAAAAAAAGVATVGTSTSIISPVSPATSNGGGGSRQVRVSASIPFIDQSPTAPQSPLTQQPSIADTLKEPRHQYGPPSYYNPPGSCGSTLSHQSGVGGAYQHPPPPHRGAAAVVAVTSQVPTPCQQPPHSSNARSTPNLPTTTPTHSGVGMRGGGVGVGSSSSSNMQQQRVTPLTVRTTTIMTTPKHVSTSSVVTSSALSGQHLVTAGSSSTASSSGCTSPAHVSAEDRAVLSRGITRSSASYGIQQMLQEQIILEEREQQKLREQEDMARVYEEKISAIREENQSAIQQLTREKQMELNNAKNRFETELETRAEESRRALDALRASHKDQMAKKESDLESQMTAIRREHAKAIDSYVARDQAWQLEKEDVLSEIQRLKQEAKRFIAILSQESDDETLSPTKRQSLTREVESLQLVVEMRTNELHQLRDERDRHLQQLEEFDSVKSNLVKMSARVEDLQAQLAEKTKLERQLSRDRQQLANSVEVESKTKARMSMQVEELQWRIKNNLELPPTQLFSPDRESPSPTSPSFMGKMATTPMLSPTGLLSGGMTPKSPNNNSSVVPPPPPPPIVPTDLDQGQNNNQHSTVNNSVKRKRSSPAKVAAERAAAAAASSSAESCSRSAGQQNGKGARGSTSSSRGSSKSPTPAAHRRPTNLDLLHTNQPEVSHNNGSGGGGVCPDIDDDDENGNGADEELVAVVRRDQVGENQGQGVHSGDEGISSEASNSPQPPLQLPPAQNHVAALQQNMNGNQHVINNNSNGLISSPRSAGDNNNCDSKTSFFHGKGDSNDINGQAVVNKPLTVTPSPKKIVVSDSVHDNPKKSPVSPLVSSPCGDERVPSRIPLSAYAGKGKN